MAAEDDLRARAVLAEMQMRISQGPHAALSVNETADAEEVRAAFLQLTKQFHPARFGRMSADVHRLANEVFLGIKSAHDQLTRLLGSSGRRAPMRPSSSVFRVPAGSGDTQRGAGVHRLASPPPQPIARGTDRPPPHRPSTPQITPPTSPPRASSAITPPTSPPGPSSAIKPPTSPPRAASPPARIATPPQGVPQQRTTPAGGYPVQRPGSPAPRLGTPPQQRPTTPANDAHNPPTIRYSGARPSDPPAASGAAFDEQRELAVAMNLLSSKNWTAARQALHALAAKMPQARQYRALLCYARGRETAATGRIDDAVMEFQRALQLDPELEIAKQAIRELGRKSRF